MREIRHSASAFKSLVTSTHVCFALVVVAAFVAGCGSGAGSGKTSSGAGDSKKASSRFSGTFSGILAEIPVKLTLEQNGDKLTGQLASAVEFSTLTATLNGDSAKGRLEDPDGTGGEVELSPDGDGLAMALTLSDAESGASQTVHVPMKRVAAEIADGRKADNNMPSGAIVRDPALVGKWRHTEAGGSGEFTYAVDTWLTVGEDGTYRYGDSKLGAGDASSTTISEGSDVQIGQWRSEDQVIYVKTAENSEWTPFAKYFAEADRMMFTYNSGKKQVWERQ